MDLSKYGIHVQYTADAPNYHLTDITKLDGNSNRGKQNIFVRVWDEKGIREMRPDLRIKVEGGPSVEFARLDKPTDIMERGHGDVPMYASTTYNISITDSRNPSSDKVIGLHTRHPDEEPGNTWGHHSYLLEFKYVPKSETTPPLNDMKERLFERMKQLMDEQADVLGELEKML